MGHEAMILCVRMPHFAAAVLRCELHIAPEVPIGVARHGKITATCGRAAEADIQIGLTVRQAQAVLPQLRIVEDDEACRRREQDRLLDALDAFTPLLECQTEVARPGRKKLKLLADEHQAAVLYVDFETLIPAAVKKSSYKL